LHSGDLVSGDGCITDVPGIRAGHYTDTGAATGCTVVLCEGGGVGGVDVRGAAPGTLETDMLRPMTLLPDIHGVMLCGGSLFGLQSAFGAIRYLEERGVGVEFADTIVPRVAGAAVFDLNVGRDVRPGPDEGYSACVAASTSPIAEGSVGAGTGASVAKASGMGHAVKGGVGTASIALGGKTVIGAVVVVNALGGIVDPDTGELVAGPRAGSGGAMVSAVDVMMASHDKPPLGNTTIGVVVTNATLTKEQANKLAAVAQDGIALAVRPAHTMGDGDTMFAIGTGETEADEPMGSLLAAVAVVTSRAITSGVRAAVGLAGLPAASGLTEARHG
jgi:L-aminopeptidase/D-esterase-like protein